MSTATPSLRRRVTASVLVLFALLLVVVGVLIDVALGAQLRRDLDHRLADREQRAEQLAAAGFGADQLIASLQGQDIRVRITTSDGQVHGDPGLAPAPPVPTGPRPVRPGTAPKPPAPPETSSSAVTRVLPGGSTLLLVADTTAIAQVRQQLRWVLVLAGLVVLVLAALVLRAGVGAALRPLDRLTGLARRITAGDRGERLAPDRPGSELGRAAAAFDEMLDALEDAERRARAGAAAALANEERTRAFLADAAHELRTPLAGIQVVAESVATAADGGSQRQRRRARLLVRETARASRLVADMLDLARIDEGVPLRPADFDLVSLVDTAVDRVRALAPDLPLRHEKPAGAGPRVHADADRVAQVLANLLDNARRHTPPGGRVTVSTGTGTGPGEAEVRVANTGPVIAEADRERIFDRLVRLDLARDRDSGGAGLGLPVARGLARAHGGDVRCVADPDGAAFVFTLPLCEPVPD